MKTLFNLAFMLFAVISTSQSIVSGRLTSAEDGHTIEGVMVSIPELNRSTISDVNGEFKLEKFPNGHFHVQFSSIGYLTKIIHADFDEEIKKLDVQLEPMYIGSQEVVVSGGAYSTQHENAIKIEILHLNELQSTNSLSVMKTLASIPGVDLISKGPGMVSPVIRGLSLSNILVLNNGVRLENYQFSENHPFMIDEQGYERIEIIKGPASLLYGSDAVGGVINFVREKPLPDGKFKGDAGLSFFGNTRGYAGSMGFTASAKGFFYGLRAGTKNHMDFVDGSANRVINSRFGETSVKLNSGYTYKFGKSAVYYDYNLMKLGITNEVSVLEVNNDSRKNELWFQDLSNQMLSVKNNLYLNSYKIDLNFSYQLNIRKEHESIIEPVLTEANMKLKSYLYELKLFVPTNEKIDFIVGLQGALKKNTNVIPGHVLPDFNTTDFSIFGLYQQQIGNIFHLQAGLRYDIRTIFVPEQERAAHDNHEVHEIIHELRHDYSNLSGSVGATYKLNKDVLIRFNYATAYRTPNVAELVQDGLHENRYEQGMRDLVSQRSHEADLSIHYHSKYATFDFSAFYNHMNDYIYIAPTADTSAEGFKIYRYTQDPARIYGMESGIAFQPVKWFDYKLTYTSLIGEKLNGDPLPFIPQNKINSYISLKYSKLKLIKEIWLNLASIYAFRQQNPALFETETSDYLIFDLVLGLKISLIKNDANITLGIQNVFDKAYYDHLSSLKEIGYYTMGRSFNISLKIQFSNSYISSN